MKLIESSAQFIPQEPRVEGVYKQIELAGRTCYKSEDKITHDSAKGFVDRMIASHHTAMLEHGTVYLKIVHNWNALQTDLVKKYVANQYSRVIGPIEEPYKNSKVSVIYITTNLRVMVENGYLDDLKYLCEPTEYHEKRYTFKFICDRGVSHELVRHRVFSFAQESTRYCNYSKYKFGNELTFMKPAWDMTLKPNQYGEDRSLLLFLKKAEILYNYLINNCKWTPQQARMILPNCLKTEIVMTGFASDWRHFFDLRMWGKTGAPHPDMQELATKAMLAAQDAGIWMSIEKQPSKFK